MTSVQFPVADLRGALVWADELAAAKERPDGLVCVGCGGSVRLHAGRRNRPHFAHRAADVCTGSETALHSVTIRVLAEVLESKSAADDPFVMAAACDSCCAGYEVDLARHRDGTVHVDSVFEDGIRPDLLVRDAGGSPRYAIEVIVTHAPDDATVAVYERLGLPVIGIWPRWEMLTELRTGLPAELHRAEPSMVGHDVLLNCPLPRHRIAEPSPCPTCTAPTLPLTVEVSRTTCWSSGCAQQPRILDVYDHSGPEPALVAAGATDLPRVREIARSLDVRLQRRYSKAAGGEYVANVCGCGAVLGDNFIYNGMDDEKVTVVTDDPVRHFSLCDRGHWTHLANRRWPAGAVVRRHATQCSGLVGTPAFGGARPDGPRAEVEMVEPRNEADMRRAVSRMVWGTFGPKY